MTKTTMSALTHILTQAVRTINRANGIKLKKVAEFGDADKGAGLYWDKDHSEYRVLFTGAGEHLPRADYHTDDKLDAVRTAETYTKPETGLEDTGVEPVTEHPEQTVTIVPPRPRGYHSHPSPLLKGLLMRGPQ